MLNELSMTTEVKSFWLEAKGKYVSASLVVYMVCKKAVLRPIGYAVLHTMADPPLSLWAMHETPDMSIGDPGMKAEKRYKFFISTLPVKEAVEAEEEGTFRNLISNQVLYKLDRNGRANRVGHYRSTSKLLMDYLEKEGMGHTAEYMSQWVFGWAY